MDESKDVAKDEKKLVRSPQQQAEIDAVKARLKELEDAPPVPIQEYPKWVEAADGQKVIVQDEAAEKAATSAKAPAKPDEKTKAASDPPDPTAKKK
jgi:hypothetical protein